MAKLTVPIQPSIPGLLLALRAGGCIESLFSNGLSQSTYEFCILRNEYSFPSVAEEYSRGLVDRLSLTSGISVPICRQTAGVWLLIWVARRTVAQWLLVAARGECGERSAESLQFLFLGLATFGVLRHCVDRIVDKTEEMGDEGNRGRLAQTGQ